jgi:hypothetical protein
MEKQYDNTNRGVLFKNDPQGNPKRPQYRGSLNVGGTEYNLSAWIKESKKTGDKFLSLSVEAKQEGQRLKAKAKQEEVPAFVDDDLPPF